MEEDIVAQWARALGGGGGGCDIDLVVRGVALAVLA